VSEVAGSPADSRTCGRVIAERLLTPDLAGIFILSDGLNVNGSELVAGITEVIGPHIPLTGGFAGDGSQFEETLVGANCAPRSRMVAGIGFYGNAIRIGHGSAGAKRGMVPAHQSLEAGDPAVRQRNLDAVSA
jgi:hypothetical protein